MRIEYRATKHRINVSDVTGRRLVQAGIAIEVDEAPKSAKRKAKAEKAEKPTEVVSRRVYRRRDMQAESDTSNTYDTRDETAGE